MSGGLGKTVCVVGAGALGLVASKNLREEGFEVTTYERNAYIGGIWHATADTTQTSAHETTRANISKQGLCFTDFPFPEGKSFPPPKRKGDSGVSRSVRKTVWPEWPYQLRTSVTNVQRDETARKWLVTTKSTNVHGTIAEFRTFDRLIIATGRHSKPNMPQWKNAEVFAGAIIHSQQFKDASKYMGQTVIVIGNSSTAADTIRFLKEARVKKIYISHRRSFRTIPLTVKGGSYDHNITRRFNLIAGQVYAKSPAVSLQMMDQYLLSLQHSSWPRLKDHPAFASDRSMPSPASYIAVVSDTLAQDLLDETAESVQAIYCISGPRSVTLVDGSELHNIDTILCCTGDTMDFSGLLPKEYDPTSNAHAPERFAELKTLPYHRGSMPRLYQNFLSIQAPHSLAFLGHALLRRSVFALYDLVTMAFTQLWASNFPMPSPEEMKVQANQHHVYLVNELNTGYVSHSGLFNGVEFDVWLNKVSATGVYERLRGWGWEACKLWLTDRRLYAMLMDGVDSPHMLRMFKTGRGRKAWEGARVAIEQANADVEALRRKWNQERGPNTAVSKAD